MSYTFVKSDNSRKSVDLQSQATCSDARRALGSWLSSTDKFMTVNPANGAPIMLKGTEEQTSNVAFISRMSGGPIHITSSNSKTPDLVGNQVNWFVNRNLQVAVSNNSFEGRNAANGITLPPVLVDNVAFASGNPFTKPRIVITEPNALIKFSICSWAACGYVTRITTGAQTISQDLNMTISPPNDRWVWSGVDRYQTGGQRIGMTSFSSMNVPNKNGTSTKIQYATCRVTTYRITEWHYDDGRKNSSNSTPPFPKSDGPGGMKVNSRGVVVPGEGIETSVPKETGPAKVYPFGPNITWNESDILGSIDFYFLSFKTHADALNFIQINEASVAV